MWKAHKHLWAILTYKPFIWQAKYGMKYAIRDKLVQIRCLPAILWKILFRGSLVAVLLFTILWFSNPPPLDAASDFPEGFVLRDGSGAVLRIGLGPDDIDCRPSYVPSTNDWIVQAIIASEDGKFLTHHGVVASSVFRAAFQNLASGRRVSGASTITMQAVRLMKPHKRTFWQKIREAFQALRLERRMTKQEILGQYLNRVPFGANIVGIDSAARGWFNCPPSELGLAEAALLAGLPQAPSRYRPDRHMDAALERRAYVFDRMEALGMITPDQRAAAEAVPLEVHRSPRPFREPWFCDWVLADHPGLRGDHRTTLSPALQQSVRKLVNSQAVEERASIAAVVLSVTNGAVLAMAVSGDYRDSDGGQVNVASAARSAGSTLKPFAFATGIDSGFLTPKTVLPDVPLFYRNYTPENFSRDFRGLVTARDALVLSLNMPALEVVRKIGVDRFIEVLRSLGLKTVTSSPGDYGLGLAIGNASVRLDELANAYAAFARGGEWRPLRPLADVEPAGAPARIFSEGASWMISDMLSGEERSLQSLGHVADAVLPRFAWKTGTSSGFRDAWTVAWNPEYVVAVWCGDKHGRSGGEDRTGIRAASPLVWEMIRTLYPSGRAPWFQRPGTIDERSVCPVSGRVPTPLCPGQVTDTYVRGVSLWTPCTVHRRGQDGTISEHWPSHVQVGLQLLGKLEDPSGQEGLRIYSPKSGSRYHLLQGFGEQRVVVRVSGVTDDQKIYWFVNGSPVEVLLGATPFVLHLEREGDFTITATSEAGSTDQVTLHVE